MTITEPTASPDDAPRTASFIAGMASYLKAAGPKYDLIGVCWFDTDTNNGYNWRVDQTPRAWQARLTLARDLHFGRHGS